jgi:ankyrin repeat protein
MELLLDHGGVDINDKSQSGWTAYDWAEYEGQAEALQFVRSRGGRASGKSG